MVRLVGSSGEGKGGKGCWVCNYDSMGETDAAHGWGGDHGHGEDLPHVGHSFFKHMFSSRIAGF